MSHSRHIRILVTEATSDKTRPAKSILHQVRLQIDNTKTAINAAVYRSLLDLTRVTASGIYNAIIEVAYLRQRSLYEELNFKKILLLRYIVKSVYPNCFGYNVW